ncbi:MAG: proton extrusion protein PcxA [Oscillatoriales cyanobacterium RM1_1_9]|nr:proton extrusion protein PcxA [Oscillatoriales cyanobacterium SM2_3_0]NJO47409.1 proton extrusion protein PcxA [Oscillatoriales cyanobacterium RM2_1_1]NJO70826.1 proton extrusion protein PcxA [Oscillatoriales cyanobacterium RM1_1_9]
MIVSTWPQIKRLWRTTNRWFWDTPERALDQAYEAALKIKALENEHFNGKKVGDESIQYSDRVQSYFKSELKKYLNIIQARLTEFNTSRSVIGISEQINPIELNGKANPGNQFNSIPENDPKREHILEICEKLNYIDAVVNQYNPEPISKVKLPISNSSGITLTKGPPQESSRQINQSRASPLSTPQMIERKDTMGSNKTLQDDLTAGSDTSFLPRSLLRTMGRIQRELNPESEEEVLRNYRKSKIKTVISVRFLLLLILVPLLTQQLAKNFVIAPIVDYFIPEEKAPLFLNIDLEEQAFTELHRYQERLEFQQMIGVTPKISEEQLEEQLQQKATEIAEKYRTTGSDAIENIFADLLSVVAFGVIIYANRQEVEILKSFLGDLIYGLSDSAKAFIIILLTDMFVGFHSPHGWEVILESVARHFGLPENRDFNFLFIATFPVILDAVFKYWIFRYLNRSSPSAVSTYKTMNE